MINPRRACVANVTVLGWLVCLSVVPFATTFSATSPKRNFYDNFLEWVRANKTIFKFQIINQQLLSMQINFSHSTEHVIHTFVHVYTCHVHV